MIGGKTFQEQSPSRSSLFNLQRRGGGVLLIVRVLSVEIGLCNSAPFVPRNFRVEVKVKELCTISINKGNRQRSF